MNGSENKIITLEKQKMSLGLQHETEVRKGKKTKNNYNREDHKGFLAFGGEKRKRKEKQFFSRKIYKNL